MESGSGTGSGTEPRSPTETREKWITRERPASRVAFRMMVAPLAVGDVPCAKFRGQPWGSRRDGPSMRMVVH